MLLELGFGEETGPTALLVLQAMASGMLHRPSGRSPAAAIEAVIPPSSPHAICCDLIPLLTVRASPTDLRNLLPVGQNKSCCSELHGPFIFPEKWSMKPPDQMTYETCLDKALMGHSCCLITIAQAIISPIGPHAHPLLQGSHALTLTCDARLSKPVFL